MTTIVSDQGRLRQVLYTFLAWAVSRSEEGQRVTIDAEAGRWAVRSACRSKTRAKPIKDMARVFDPEETPRAGKTDLNELGIIIGRRLLEVMKGTVTLKNRDSGGLRTLIELPAGPPKDQPQLNADVHGQQSRIEYNDFPLILTTFIASISRAF